jgi:triosephosphate isomerase (TIM)
MAYRGVEITPPFFEIGPKTYMWGGDMVDLARRADVVGRTYRVQVVLSPQYTDIAAVAREVESVLVFAQHMDSLVPGRGIGAVLPEAIRAAGATGVLLNHVERRLSHDELARTIRRADEVGLATMVCADDVRGAAAVAALRPNAIIVEEPLLIGGGSRDEAGRQAIAAANEAVWSVDPGIRVLHGAGIKDARDVYDVIAAGAQGTGSSSAIFASPDPLAMLEDMIRAVRDAWDRAH